MNVRQSRADLGVYIAQEENKVYTEEYEKLKLDAGDDYDKAVENLAHARVMERDAFALCHDAGKALKEKQDERDNAVWRRRAAEALLLEIVADRRKNGL